MNVATREAERATYAIPGYEAAKERYHRPQHYVDVVEEDEEGEDYDDTEISRVDELSRVETKVHMSRLGIGIPRGGSAGDSDGVLLARHAVFREFGHVFSGDHVRFDPRHPAYIYIYMISQLFYKSKG